MLLNLHVPSWAKKKAFKGSFLTSLVKSTSTHWTKKLYWTYRVQEVGWHVVYPLKPIFFSFRNLSQRCVTFSVEQENITGRQLSACAGVVKRIGILCTSGTLVGILTMLTAAATCSTWHYFCFCWFFKNCKAVYNHIKKPMSNNF